MTNLTNKIPPFGQQKQQYLVICNFLPTQDHQIGTTDLLRLWMGDLVEICARQGEWCFGRRLEEPEKLGLFPWSHCRELPEEIDEEETEDASEAEMLANEIGEAVKNWWESTKASCSSGETSAEKMDQQILLIRQLMMLRRRLRSGTVPAEELRELRMTVANAIDAGNHAMGLGMQIRDEQGRRIQAEDLSVVNAYKKHEKTSQHVAIQAQHILDPSLDDKLAQSGSGPVEWTLLISVEHSELARASDQNAELVFGLGKTTKQKTPQSTSRTTKPLTEPLTIRLASANKMRSSRTLFVGLTESDLREGLSLWMTALKMASLNGEKGQKTSGKAEDVRQFFAHGQMELGELIKDMSDKEQRETTLMLTRKIAICVPPAATASTNSAPQNSAERLVTKVPISLTVQLLAGTKEQLVATNTELRLLPQLQKLKQSGERNMNLMPEEKRNEMFIWLRDGDFHGIGKSEKNIEAVLSVVDDDGVFQPDAIEIVTPDGPIRESSFRCRVWPAEDRPRFNELIKVLLPEQEVRNLHLQILFYNKTVNDKKSLTNSSSKFPFALAFLRLLHNHVLCTDDEDELFIYRVDKAKASGNGGDFVSNVAYLSSWAKRKEMRQPPAGQQPTRSASVTTLAKGMDILQQPQNGGMYTLCEKNGLQFHSFVCSQTHCSHEALVQILRWRENEQHLLRLRLLELTTHDLGELHEELVNFLPDLFDALFQIAEHHSQLQRHAFDALVQICRHCEESRQPHLQTMLEQYVQHMHFPKAHSFLLEHIIWYVTNGGYDRSNDQKHQMALPIAKQPSFSGRDHLLPVLKSMGFLVRLALASKSCENLIRQNGEGREESAKEQQQFMQQLDNLRSALVLLLGSAVRRITGQNAAMKHLPALVLPLLEQCIYEPLEVANFVKEVLDSLADGILLRQKLLFLGEIVSSELFASPDCRNVLLERFLTELLSQMPPHARQEEQQQVHLLQRRESVANESTSGNAHLEAVHLSAEILTDLLDRLFPYSRHSPVDQSGTDRELSMILRKIILLGDPMHQRTLHMLLLAILDKFSARHFAEYFAQLKYPLNKIDTLSEMLHMFRDLMLRCPVPQQWVQIRHLQSRVFLKHIRFAAGYVQREFANENRLWMECMLSCITFAKCAFKGQEKEFKRVELDEKGKEMREFAVKMLRSLWHSLTPTSKLELMPDMVGPILEIALCEDEPLQALAMPLFFDMLVTEHWMTAPVTKFAQAPATPQQDGVVLRKAAKQQQTEPPWKSSFVEKFITTLDITLDTSTGKFSFEGFKRIFNRTFEQQAMPRTVKSTNSLSREGNIMRDFVQKVNRLLELFIAYLSVKETDNLEMGMFCTVQLVDFYHSIGQNELYVVYLYKLYELHIKAVNWVEAALALQRHASLLKWTRDPIDPWQVDRKKQNCGCQTQLELKEQIYLEMAELFAKGSHWELAIETNKELASVYETILFDYTKLAALLKRTANLYKKVIGEIRLECNYFLVAFYGRECPAYLTGKKFIFRGQQLELWGAFKQRLMANFPDFNFVDSMDDCDEMMRNMEGKFMQIVAVTPVPSADHSSLLQSPSRLASWYYKHHRVDHFELIRREFRNESKWTQLEDTETMRLWLHKRVIAIQKPLPDLLSFAQVSNEHELKPLSPLEVAIEKIREANDKLAELSSLVSEGFAAQFLMNLGGMVRGIVQADVGGGIKNYQVFFTTDGRSACSEEENISIDVLKALILEQITLLEYAIYVHSVAEQTRANASFHNSLVSSFEVHRERVESYLGKAGSILPEAVTLFVSLEKVPEQQGGKPATLSESRLSMHSISALSNLTTSPITKGVRSQSVGESQYRLNSAGPSTSSQLLRPPSAVSASNSSGSTGSGSTAAAIFRNSPLGAASSLIRTTIQAKSKQKRGERKNSKKSVTATDEEQQPFTPNASTNGPSSSQLLSTAFAHTRVSDASLECFPMESGHLAPPLPPRQSNLHSEQILRKDRAKSIGTN